MNHFCAPASGPKSLHRMKLEYGWEVKTGAMHSDPQHLALSEEVPGSFLEG